MAIWPAIASPSTPGDLAPASAHLRGGVLTRLRIAGVPKWSLDVAVAYREGFEDHPAARIVQVLTRTASQVAAALPR